MNPLPTTKRIVAIENPASLRLERSRLMIGRLGQPTVAVPLEDLGVLVLDYAEINLTLHVLAALAEAEVAVIIAGPKHLPVATYLPFAAHHQHALIVRKQAAAGEPTKKRVWQQIVQAKIMNQGSALAEAGAGKPDGTRQEFGALAAEVGSGDPTNREAVAAARYFPRLFGEAFLREPESGTLTNAMLNYGYALIRGAVARAVCGAGLHPAFGVFHHNRYDPYALVDDAMEPLRPIVDLRVRRYEGEDAESLTPPIKRYLYPVMTATVTLDGERLPLFPALEKYGANLRRCLLGEAKKLHCPERLTLPDS